MTDNSGRDSEEVRGTEIVVVLERDEDGKPTETVKKRVPRSVTTKVQYRNKSKRNGVWDWSGTIRLDLSDSGLQGDREGLIDLKYIEGGIFVAGEADSDE